MIPSIDSAPPICITSGEPAGIGPDQCVLLSQQAFETPYVVIGDPELIRQRADQLNISVKINLYPNNTLSKDLDVINVYPCALKTSCRAGELNLKNSPYVLEILDIATQGCLSGEFSAMVTTPVHKGVINDAGIAFTGHTEYIAEHTGGVPVMMLATEGLRVALVTTHLPLSEVANAITREKVEAIIRLTHFDLKHRFKIAKPKILICGLNPHAGEDGHLGKEEIEVINPVIEALQHKGMDIEGSYPADTIFTPPYIEKSDAIIAMYHDQGLPVLKHKGFGQAVNITMGLPIIRTSVDHGTALSLAGTGQVSITSLQYAIDNAMSMMS